MLYVCRPAFGARHEEAERSLQRRLFHPSWRCGTVQDRQDDCKRARADGGVSDGQSLHAVSPSSDIRQQPGGWVLLATMSVADAAVIYSPPCVKIGRCGWFYDG